MDNELKQRYAEAVYKQKALLIREQPFDLHSGGKSHIYLNHRQILTNHKFLQLIASAYLSLIEEKVKKYSLGAVASEMSPVIVGAMSALGSKNVVVTLAEKMKDGTKDDIYGELNDEVVLVDDVTSTGGSLIEIANKIRARGGTVNYAVVSACRDNNAQHNLAKVGITLLYIATYEEVIRMLMPTLSAKEKQLAQKEFEL